MTIPARPSEATATSDGVPATGMKHPVFQALALAISHHTGQRLTLADWHADLRRDLRLNEVTLELACWDAAVELGHHEERLFGQPGCCRPYRTVAELIETLAVGLNAPIRDAFRSSPSSSSSSNGRTPVTRAGGVAPYSFAWEMVPGPVEPSAIEADFPMPVEFVAGTPEEMGAQYGRSQAENMRRYISRNINMIGLERLKVMPELQDALANPSLYFTTEEVDEIRAMAAAAEIPWDCVLGHNVGLYPDYVPGCSQFALVERRNPEFGLVHGVNEDSPYSLLMRQHLTRVMTVRCPAGGIPHVTFGIAGQVGGMNGVNAAGLTVSSTLMIDRPRRRETFYGLTQPVLVKKVLEATSTIEDAVELIRSYPRTGAWSMAISHAPTDRLCFIEFDGPQIHVQYDVDSVATTNHCTMHAPLVPPLPHSLNRLKRLKELLALESNRGLSPGWARSILRDRYDLSRGRETAFPTWHTIRRVDNQGSMVVVARTGELWVTAGPMAPDLADRYFRISLKSLFQPERFPKPLAPVAV